MFSSFKNIIKIRYRANYLYWLILKINAAFALESKPSFIRKHIYKSHLPIIEHTKNSNYLQKYIPMTAGLASKIFNSKIFNVFQLTRSVSH